MAQGFTVSDTSNVSDMSKIAVAASIANIEPAGPAQNLVHDVPIANGEKQINLPLWDRMTATALTEAQEVGFTQAQVTVRQLTATEHGLASFISDRLGRQNNENVIAQVGSMQGLAVGRLRDTDVIGLFDGVSKSFPGTGQIATWDDLAGASSYLRTDNNTAFGPAPGKANAVLHPEQIRFLAKDVAGVGAASGTQLAAQPIPEGMSADVIENYFRGTEKLAGFRVWEDGNIARDTSNESKGSVFVEMAFTLATAYDITAESERDIQLRGEIQVTVAEWGELENVDTWATEIYSSSVAIS
jgi:hypothetical protein